MGNDYTLCGLRVRSDLPLPCPTDPGKKELPRLSLAVASRRQLGEAWSGSASESAWRGRLRDGSELAIAWGRDGDLLFSQGDRSRFLLSRSGEAMLCATDGAAALEWQRVLLSRVLPVVAIARGYEALHASAVQTAFGTVAIAGASGAGKSTLAAELLRRGHRLFTDDVLVLDPGTLAQPGGPHLSLEPGGEADLGLEVLGELGGKLWALVEAAANEPSPLAAVALLERGSGERVEVEEISPSPLALAPFMLGLPDERGRASARFSLYADLVEESRLVRLRGPADAPAWEYADALEQALVRSSPTLAAAR